MKKTILLLLVVLFFFFAPKAIADEKFDTRVSAHYVVADDGTTKVTEVVAITNKTAYYFTPSYTMNLGVNDARDILAVDNGNPLPFDEIKTNGGIHIKVTFPERTVGLGQVNTFEITFTSNTVATRLGNIWQITLPGLESPNMFSSYIATLSYPKSFGQPSIIKPLVFGTQNTSQISFTKDQIGKAGALILFGKSQYFSLNLLYHIANQNLFPIKTEIALPPDTNYQTVIINSMSQKPINTYQDPDGNWMALYSLAPEEQKTIRVNAFIKLISAPQEVPLSSSEKAITLSQEPFWPVDDPKIKAIALKLNTPQAIYDYVVRTLMYDYSKPSDENTRLGALGALAHPNQSVCLEFTDLFVTLARAAGIPARSVEGYAYTQNNTLRPLSLVKDVLHAWPEYYDPTRKTWIMVDPTWGNTTSGIDYFSSLDLSHIAFVIKGKDSTYPIPAGGYKFNSSTKDVNVSFLPPQNFTDHHLDNVTFSFSSQVFSGFPIHALLTIHNMSGSAINNRYVEVDSSLSPKKQSIFIKKLLPFGQKSYDVTYNAIPFLTNATYEVTIRFNGKTYSKLLRVTYMPDINTIILGGILLAVCFIISGFTYKTWSLLIQKRKK